MQAARTTCSGFEFHTLTISVRPIQSFFKKPTRLTQNITKYKTGSGFSGFCTFCLLRVALSWLLKPRPTLSHDTAAWHFNAEILREYRSYSEFNLHEHSTIQKFRVLTFFYCRLGATVTARKYWYLPSFSVSVRHTCVCRIRVVACTKSVEHCLHQHGFSRGAGTQ